MGQLDIIEQGTFRNVQLRDVAGTLAGQPGVPGRPVATRREHMGFMTSLVGKYPFDVYGVPRRRRAVRLRARDTDAVALHPGFLVDETQSDPIDAEPILPCTSSRHQWFGDDLAPAEWSDVWLSEGHATWYEALYADRSSA